MERHTLASPIASCAWALLVSAWAFLPDAQAGEEVQAGDPRSLQQTLQSLLRKRKPSKTYRPTSMYDGRTDEGRKAAVQQYGGTIESEAAVDLALDWLKRHQSPDGQWSGAQFGAQCVHGGRCQRVRNSHDIALTGFAILTFTGRGHTHRRHGSMYRGPVLRAKDWLLSHQAPDGGFHLNATRYATGRYGTVNMYEQGIATFALADLYAVSKDASLKAPVEAAVAFILYAQNKTHRSATLHARKTRPGAPAPAGPITASDPMAWRYTPRCGNNDTSVTGWQVLALKSAKQAGVAVHPDGFTGAGKWISLCTDSNSGAIGYTNRRRPTPTMTSVGMACRLFMGASPRDPVLVRGARYLKRYPPESQRDLFYYWYYGTLAMFQMGGQHWEFWNTCMRSHLVRTQKKGEGCERGSWELGRSPWGRRGGRIYTTTMAALTLQAYYRYARTSDLVAGGVGRD